VAAAIRFPVAAIGARTGRERPNHDRLAPFAGADGGTAAHRNALCFGDNDAGRTHLPGGADPRHFRQARMKDDQAKREGKAGGDVRDPRRDRLKAALRENLKRRKSQARGRDDPGAASSEPADASLDDAGGETPGQ
jgi:hypothetical protein